MNSNRNIRGYVDSGLSIFAHYYAPFVDAVMEQTHGYDWPEWVHSRDKKAFSGGQVHAIKSDPGLLLKALFLGEMKATWLQHGLDEYDLKRAKTLHTTRNQFYHFNPKYNKPRTVEQTLMNIEAMLRKIEAFEGAAEVRVLLAELREPAEMLPDPEIPQFEDLPTVADNALEGNNTTIAEPDEETLSEEPPTLSEILNNDDSITELLNMAVAHAVEVYPKTTDGETSPQIAKLHKLMKVLDDYRRRQLWFEFEQSEIEAIVRALWMFTYCEDAITSVVPASNAAAAGVLDEDMIVNYYSDLLEGLVLKWERQ